MKSILCDDSWMGHCAKYQLQSGGKKFRALLALITADMFKLDFESSLDIAVCCEFIHNASLIHDDLQDRDLLRRGLPTIWNRFGDHTAINLGDYFIAGSYDILTKINVNPEYKCNATSELSRIIKQTLKGQSLEILGRSDFDLRMEDYESTAKAKTGGLICLPIKLVMILLGKQINESYFKPLYEAGLAYQIQDDLSDFLGIKDRGLPGRDLKEGKMNVLIMHFLKYASNGEKFLLKEFLKKKSESISEEDILNWIKTIKSKGIIEKSIKHLVDVSKKSITQAYKLDKKIYEIVKFVNKNILNRISKKLKTSMKKAIVVGSGFGGIASALRLKALGYEVNIFEKLNQLGGRARVFKKSGYTFDAGPTVITAPFLFDELFQLFNKKREEYIKFVKLDPWYRFYFSENDKFFDYCESLKKTEKEISKFNSEDIIGYHNLVNFSEKIFNVGFDQLSATPFHNFFFMIKQLPKLLMLKSYLTVFGLVKKFIKNKQLRQALSIQPLLLGGNPTSTTSIYNLIHFLERKWGVHYAMGGTGNLIKALCTLMKEEKIKISLKSEVTNLLTTKIK